MIKSLIESYVYFENITFYVSTINRLCSALYASDLIYAETIVWKCEDNDKHIVGMYEDSKDSIEMHTNICQQLFKYGEIRISDN